MVSLICQACDETLEAATEDELVELGTEHAGKHGHVPPREHVLARIRKHNSS
jgi:hypothetical protein